MSRVSPLEGCHPPSVALAEVEGATVPWRYSTVEEEYAALRTQAAVFDHGSVGLLAVMGDDAMPFLQEVLARDVEFLTPEQSMLSLLLDDNGSPIDLVTVYGQEGGLLLETSFGRGDATAKYLMDVLPTGVELVDMGADRVVIGVEGPYAWKVVGSVVDEDFTALPFESVVEAEWEGSPLLFARNGFTGEYGYKLVTGIETAGRLWEALTQQAVPAGYEVLETAMLEVRQPILHREVQPGDSALAAGLNWLIDATKEHFRGRDAVMREFEAGPAERTIGFRRDGAPPAAGSPVRVGDTEVGRVVHAVHSPGVGACVGLARVQSDFAAAGLDFTVDAGDDGSSSLHDRAVRTLSAPYVIPASWSTAVG